ncbi:MAG: glycosyltransferase, partial [Dehalococcoidia bacterium]
MKIIAVIPCLNEAAYIGDVIGKALKHVDRVLVVDDGSGDNTSEV